MAEIDSKFEVKEISPSVELRALLKQARKATGFPDYVANIPFPSKLGKLDLSLILILDTKPSCRKALIKSELQKQITMISTYIDEQIQALPDKLAIELLNSIFKLFDELIDQLIQPYDSMINGALRTYNKLVRLFRKLSTPGISEEDKKKIEQYFWWTLKKIIDQFPYAADVIALIMMIDCLKTTIRTLRDVKKASPDDFATTAEKIKYTQELLDSEMLRDSAIVMTIVYVLKLFMPIILALAAIFGTSKAYDKELNEKMQEVLEEQNKHNEGQLYAAKHRSEIEKLALDNLDGFSYVPPQKETEPKPDIPEGDLCHSELDFTNLCPQEKADTDTPSKIFGAFIEIDPVSVYQYSKSAGVDLEIDDQLGTINGVKIVSPVAGEMYSIEKNIAVIKYKDESNDEITDSISVLSKMASQNIANGTMNNEMQEIVDKFQNLDKAKTVIREYLLYGKLPSIPLEICNQAKTKVNLDTIYSDLSKRQDELLKDFQEEIQKTTGKEHVESTLNGAGLEVLKDEIFALNNKFYDGQIYNYKNYLEHKDYCCDTESIISYKLLPYYLGIYENITLDDDNQYVTEFASLIRQFIATRKSLESLSKEDFLITLNNMCDTAIKSKWTFKESYISKFDKIYTETTDKTKQDPLYSFLENLMDCAEVEQAPVEFSSLEDMQNASSNYTRDASKDEIRKKLKDICKQYLLYREVRDFTEPSVDNRTDTKNALINQTRNEASLLNIFFDKVIHAYRDGLSVLDPSTFDKFKKVTPTKKQNVYYNGVEYEHYYVEYKEDSDKIELMDDFNKDQLDLASSPLTGTKQFSMTYWLLYCLQATLVHCMLPMYWPCGLIVMGAPIPLPVIYIPIYYLGGSVGCLFGIGLCGMAIWPMILCVNFNMDVRTILMPINILVDTIRAKCTKLITNARYTIQDMAAEKANSFKKETENYDREIERIDAQILQLKFAIGDVGRARKIRRRRRQMNKALK